MSSSAVSAQDTTLARQLFDAHPIYQERALTQRRFKHSDLVPLLEQLGQREPLQAEVIGQSTEKRSIYKVQAGSGATPVLLWSQMHGDEATATMALFDIFNFLQSSGDDFDSLRTKLLRELTLHFVPMLNPDGAERWQRRTSLDIDMNRDALRLQSPESVLLKSLQQTLKPLVGFNLHDQNPRYSVGKTGKQAVMSFLATAYDRNRNVNDVRRRSMQLIAGLNRLLQPFIPGQIARYDDEFEPRAFGDNIQKWGTTLILIESGGYKGDSEKMAIRRLNFVAILSALNSIADRSYEQEKEADYAAIPENGRQLYDVLIRNATVVGPTSRVRMDIGINNYERNINRARDFRYESRIDDLGDLSTFNGLTEIDATGMELVPARVYPDVLTSAADLAQLDLDSLRHEGVVAFRMSRSGKSQLYSSIGSLAVHILMDGTLPARPLRLEQIPTFLLKKDDVIQYLVVNGQVIPATGGDIQARFGIVD